MISLITALSDRSLSWAKIKYMTDSEFMYVDEFMMSPKGLFYQEFESTMRANKELHEDIIKLVNIGFGKEFSEEFKFNKYEIEINSNYVSESNVYKLALLYVCSIAGSRTGKSKLVLGMNLNNIHPSCVAGVTKFFIETINSRGLDVTILTTNPTIINTITGGEYIDGQYTQNCPDIYENISFAYYREDTKEFILKELKDMPRSCNLTASCKLGDALVSGRLDDFVRDERTEEEVIHDGLVWFDEFSKSLEEI